MCPEIDPCFFQGNTTVQTSMEFGHPHWSEGHLRHDGCQALVQEDLQLRLPDGDIHSHIGMPFIGQTTLPMFDHNLRH